MLRVVIVDDEPLARRGLRHRLAELADTEVVGECANGKEALKTVAELSPDMVFLDIQMPGMSGFDVVARLQQDNMPLIVFVTAYDEYAIEAFEVNAIDYLLKPIDPERLSQSVVRARNASHNTKRRPTSSNYSTWSLASRGNPKSQLPSF